MQTPKPSLKSTRKGDGYLQQPTKPLQFKPNSKNIQKVYPNRKAKQKTKQERKAGFESDRNSEIEKKMLDFSDSIIQTPEIIQKSKPETFITECVRFTAYQNPALQRELKQNVDQCNLKRKTLQNWKSIPDEKKEIF